MALPKKIPAFSYKLKTNDSCAFSQNDSVRIMEALDYLFVAKKYQEMGSCGVCKKICLKKCPSCNVYYCSPDCQNLDWPKHRLVCTNTRDETCCTSSSIDLNKSPSNGLPLVQDDIIFQDQNLPGKNTQSPFQISTNQLHKSSGKFSPGDSNVKNSRKFQNESPPNKNFGKKDGTNKSFKETSPQKNDQKKKFTHNKSVNKLKKPNFDQNITNKNMNLSFSKKENEDSKDIISPVASESPKEVICFFRESNKRYWVMNSEDLPKYATIQSVLAENCDTYQTIQPTLNLICGCKYNNEWFRGKVISLYPTVAIHFIDFGNVSDNDFDSVKELPEDLISIPNLAHLIEFEEGTPDKYIQKDLDSIKLTIKETKRTADGVMCVKIIDGVFGFSGTLQENFPKKIESSVLDDLTETSKGKVFFDCGLNSILFGSVAPTDENNVAGFIDKILTFNASDEPFFEAEEGDYVLIPVTNRRGKVIFKLGCTYFIQLIDTGNNVVVESVHFISEAAKKIPKFGGQFNILNKFVEGSLENLKSAFFEIIGKQSDGKWLCKLKDIKTCKVIAECLLSKPPETMESDPKVVPVKSGSIVEITTFHLSNIFYIRPLNAVMEKQLLEMNNIMSRFATAAESLSSLPNIGELCCAKFTEDECFYRAKVIAVSDKKVKIFFIDFGNMQTTNLEDLKPIPHQLKIIPFFAVKVNLGKVNLEQLPVTAKKYLKNLVTDGEELILTYKESIDEEVTLEVKSTGVIVNDILQNLIEKNKSEDESGTAFSTFTDIFKESDLQFMALTPSNQCELLGLYINQNKFRETFSFWATDANDQNVPAVLGDLNGKIIEYCNRNSEPYRPTAGELCLAKFEGEWYRALTVSCSNDHFNVSFFDFGNSCIVKSSSIRKIKKEFIERPVLAVKCVVNGHERFQNDPILISKAFTILQEFILKNIEGVEVVKFENDAYFVKIPQIEAILAK